MIYNKNSLLCQSCPVLSNVQKEKAELIEFIKELKKERVHLIDTLNRVMNIATREGYEEDFKELKIETIIGGYLNEE